MRDLLSLFVFLLFFLLVNGVCIQAKDTIAISSIAHGQILFEEDFESFDRVRFDLALEYLSNTGWDYNWTSVSGGDVASIVANSLEKDNQSLRFSGNSDVVNIAKHDVNVSSPTKELVLEVVLRIDQSASSNDSATILGIARSTYAERRNLVRFLTNLSEIVDTALVFAGNGFIRVKDMTICTYSACTWYTLKVIYDMSTAHTQSVFLDEKLVQERSLDPITSNDLCFFILSYNQSVLLDSISIFEPLSTTTLIQPFYNQSWFWILPPTVAAFVASVCVYIGLRRKIAALELTIRGRIRTRALLDYMQDIIDRKPKEENWERKYHQKFNTAKTIEEALRKLGFTKD